jgi:hypothetical protein
VVAITGNLQIVLKKHNNVLSSEGIGQTGSYIPSFGGAWGGLDYALGLSKTFFLALFCVFELLLLIK